MGIKYQLEKEFDMKFDMRFVLKILFVVVFVLVVPALVQAQHQQLPGIIKNGFRLCQDGMGESVIDPTVRIPWSEVLELSGGTANKSVQTVSVPIGTVKSVVPIDPVPATKPAVSVPTGMVQDPVPKASVKSASELKKDLGQAKIATKNCPNGWVPSFGDCPPEKWDPWGREKRPYQFRDIVGVKLDKGVGNYGSPTFKFESAP